MKDPRVWLVIPTNFATGMGIFTPRCLPVLAAATPKDLVGDAICVDEAIKRMDINLLREGDIVGISISTHNCRAGYDLARKARKRGATVIMGGPHVSALDKIRSLRDEPLEQGANAVVAGDGDDIWEQVIRDVLEHNLRERYDGSKVAGERLRSARWDVLNFDDYLMPTLQTGRGCPESCSFCSVPQIDGGKPRQRYVVSVAEELLFLRKHFPFVLFADDNFFPASLTRIKREEKPERQKYFMRLREERLAFLRELAKLIGRPTPAFVQMTAETVDDDEAMKAIRDVGVKVALFGFESFTAAGRKDVHKTWGPNEEKAIEVVRKAKEYGVYSYASIICGLPSDTPETIARTAHFVTNEMKPLIAQFTIIQANPGSPDYLTMRADMQRRSSQSPILEEHNKQSLQLIRDKFWLDEVRPRMTVKHPTMSDLELLASSDSAWRTFYALRKIFDRVAEKDWPLAGQIALAFGQHGFYKTYAGHGISADSAKTERTKLVPKLLFRGTKVLLRAAIPAEAAV